MVYARFVLTHLRDPAAGVATMVAALKRGGRLVVEDIDFRGSFCEPENPSFERYEEIYEESAFGQRRRPVDRRSGCRPCSPPPASRASSRTVVQPAALEGEVKLMPALTLENIKATAIRHGVADADEIDALVDELYAIAARPAHLRRQPAHRAGLRREALTAHSRISAASSHSDLDLVALRGPAPELGGRARRAARSPGRPRRWRRSARSPARPAARAACRPGPGSCGPRAPRRCRVATFWHGRRGRRPRPRRVRRRPVSARAAREVLVDAAGEHRDLPVPEQAQTESVTRSRK